MARITITASHQFKISKKYFFIPKASNFSKNSQIKIKVKSKFIYLKAYLISIEANVSKAKVIVLHITQNIIKF